jgi:methylated-DNA-[protein]-cysteine S-methyltransferase
MSDLAYTLFETAIGTCTIAWGPRGLVAVQLPEGGEAAARKRIERRFENIRESAPSDEMSAIIDRIRGLLEGGRDDLADVRLDLDRVSEFQRRVYAVARAIAPGRTRTYGEIARELGPDPRLARDVGEAMGQNPWPIVVPCHRVVAAGGKLGGFSARGGASTKQRMLAVEGAEAAGQGELFG